MQTTTATPISTTPKAHFPHVMKREAALTDLTFGSIAGILGKFIEFPFDTIKVRLQTQPTDVKYFTSSSDVLLKTLKNEGVTGLYKGLSTPLFGSILENSMLFAGYGFFQSQIRSFSSSSPSQPLTIPQLCAAGWASGFMVSFLLTPIEMIKCNLQVQDVGGLYGGKISGKFNGPFDTLKGIVKGQGIGGLYRGVFGTMLRESFGGVAWFGSYETICRHFINRRQHISTTGTITKKDLNPGELMGAGAVAGILFNSALFPADVIKARQQIVSNGRANGFVKEAIGLYKSEGVKGFFRGYGITAAKAGPASAVIFLCYEMLNRNFAY